MEEEAMLKVEEENDDEEDEEEEEKLKQNHTINSIIMEELVGRLGNGDLKEKIEAAMAVRKLVRKSNSKSSKSVVRSRLASAGVIDPLVSMLQPSFPLSAREPALLALLNLAVRNQRNKIRIVTSGAIPPLLELLKFQHGNLKELAAAAILTLSSAAPNKPTIAASGVAPLLVRVLCSGSVQGRVDAVTALYNLSTCEEDPKLVLAPEAVPPLIDLLKECKKYSKFAEKTTALLEILSNSDEGRIAITNVDGGILTLVETVEDGSLVSTAHAVGALLSLCQSSRDKYRELILREGAIPGLLRLTAEGTPEAQDRARILLDLLRESPPQNRLTSSVLERIVYNFAAHVDGTDKANETAKKLLRDMVQKSMEHSLSHMQLRASSPFKDSVNVKNHLLPMGVDSKPMK
ncbi:ARM repeat superfamily protein [Abeliophyllum distichum]|uniref:ARM repeat superfamily protein n=1 Tax=Abeliophyllum distichum TaxID=126358 RepID=A0ABD1UIE0_9LAMI